MAAHEVKRAKTFALTGTGTQDTVTITGGYKYVHVINHSIDAAEKINFSVDGTTTATTPPDETDVVLAINPVGIYTKVVSEFTAPVVKIRPVSGTPTVTVRGTNYVN